MKYERAMTLVELLAVVAILALSATAAIGIAGPMSAGQRSAEAVGAVVDALTRARRLAEATEGTLLCKPAVTLELGATISCLPGEGAPSDSALFTAALPAGWTAEVTDAAPGRPIVRFWEGGVSDDAVIEMRAWSGAFARLELLGVSGQVTALTPPTGNAR